MAAWTGKWKIWYARSFIRSSPFLTSRAAECGLRRKPEPWVAAESVRSPMPRGCRVPRFIGGSGSLTRLPRPSARDRGEFGLRGEDESVSRNATLPYGAILSGLLVPRPVAILSLRCGGPARAHAGFRWNWPSSDMLPAVAWSGLCCMGWGYCF